VARAARVAETHPVEARGKGGLECSRASHRRTPAGKMP